MRAAILKCHIALLRAPDHNPLVVHVHSTEFDRSGVNVDQPCAWLLDHVDGVLTRFEPFPNRVDEARAAVRR